MQPGKCFRDSNGVLGIRCIEQIRLDQHFRQFRARFKTAGRNYDDAFVAATALARCPFCIGERFAFALRHRAQSPPYLSRRNAAELGHS